MAPVSPAAGAALRLVAAAGAARAVVEIGTGTGVSGLWLLRGMRADGVLTTIDMEAEHQRVARRVFAAAGLPPVAHPDHHRPRPRGAAPARRRRLRPGVRAPRPAGVRGGASRPAQRLLRPGGLLVLGDAWSGGRLTDPTARDPHTVALREVLKALRDEDGLAAGLPPHRRRAHVRRPAVTARRTRILSYPPVNLVRMSSRPPPRRTPRSCPPSRRSRSRASLAAMSGFRPSAGDQLIMGDRLRKGLPHPDEPREAVVVEVGAAARCRARRPAGRVRGAPAVRDRRPAQVERWVRAWLSLDDDIRPFLELAADDPPVAALLPLVHGLHQVRFGSLAEGTAYFALTQRSTQWFATARKARIAAELGPRAAVDGETFVAFPRPGRAGRARCRRAALLRRQRPAGHAAGRGARRRGRARRGRGCARRPYEEARQALLGVRGIGAFTANAILLRVLGRPDDVPLEMAQFTTAMAEVYGAAAPDAGRAARPVRPVRRLVGLPVPHRARPPPPRRRP